MSFLVGQWLVKARLPLLTAALFLGSLNSCKQAAVKEEQFSSEEGLSPVDGIKFFSRLISIFAKYSSGVGNLHKNISNAERLAVIKDVPISEILCAPGHLTLRNPSSVIEMAKQISRVADGGKSFVRGKEKIVLNVFTTKKKNNIGPDEVIIRSIEVMDGNHRLAAGLLARQGVAKDMQDISPEALKAGKPVWQKIGDIPEGALEIRVNGYKPLGGGQPLRWIPMSIFNDPSCQGPCLELKKGLRGYFKVIQDDRGNQAAEVSGELSSIDETIPVKFMGRRIADVLQASLSKVAPKN